MGLELSAMSYVDESLLLTHNVHALDNTPPQPLWRSNDGKAQKHGSRRNVYWAKKEKGDWRTGSQYLGEWHDNRKEGKGTQVYASGNKYVGGWSAGQRFGVGTYWVKEGGQLRKQYAGEWFNNMHHVSCDAAHSTASLC